MSQQLDPTPIMQTATAFWASKVLLTAVEFDLFSTLGGTAMTAHELSDILVLHPRGAYDFLEKPLDRDAFLGTVQVLLKENRERNSVVNHDLTKTDIRVLHLILEGKNNREIAAALHWSPRTVEVHRSHVMHKMGASNLVELLRRAADVGLFDMGNSSPR